MSKSFSSNHQLIRFTCALDITNLCGIYSLNNSAIIIIGQYLANVIFSCLFLLYTIYGGLKYHIRVT